MAASPIEPVSLAEARAARERLAGIVTPSPLVPLEHPGPPGPIHLKLENLQPIGSFKLRGAANAVASLAPEALEAGVATASAGNMARGLAWMARRLGVPCRVLVPDHAPAAKLEPVRRLGGEILTVPFEEWWRALEDRGHPDLSGTFVHPVADPAVVAGNATIGLELLDELPLVRTVFVPFGGGGLVTGIASVLAAERPDVAILACEVSTAAPLAGALAAGRPVEVDYAPSFVDGIGGRAVLPEMWPVVARLVQASVVVTPERIAEALRLLVSRVHVVAEGAGAAPLAAALAEPGREGPIACVVSGGNIDTEVLGCIVAGGLPGSAPASRT